MHKRLILLFLSVLLSNIVLPQTVIDTSSIREQLHRIYLRDQGTRVSDSITQLRVQYNSMNLAEIETLISRYGWPGKSFVGPKGNNTVWLVIQHAELATQLKYLPLLQKSVAVNESRSIDLALLEDRVLMRQGKDQVYWSQIWINKTTSAQEIWPITDEINVNNRRVKIGLETMELYAKRFGMEYKLPEK